jgi:hypothetical protein
MQNVELPHEIASGGADKLSDRVATFHRYAAWTIAGCNGDVTVPALLATASENTYLTALREGFPGTSVGAVTPPDEHGIASGKPASAGTTVKVHVLAFATVACSFTLPPSGGRVVAELVKLAIDGADGAAVAGPTTTFRQRTAAPVTTSRRARARIDRSDTRTASTSRTPRSSPRPILIPSRRSGQYRRVLRA